MAKGPLESYLFHLSQEFDVDGENLTVVVDNAHIPLHFEEETLKEAFSLSLSALDNTRFPPQFLRDDDRWNSMESSAASDVSLNMPSRTRDSLDERIDRLISNEKSTLTPQASMDSTERLLRELPLDGPVHTTRTTQTRRQNRDAPKSPMRTKDDELPSLKHCPYSDEIEAHPSVGIRRLPESVALGLTGLFKSDSTTITALLDEDGVDNEIIVPDGQSPETSGEDVLPVGDLILPDKVRLSNSLRGIHENSTDMSSNETTPFKRRDLRATVSPKAVYDFATTKKNGGPNRITRNKSPHTLSPKGASGPRRVHAMKGSMRSRPSIFQSCHV